METLVILTILFIYGASVYYQKTIVPKIKGSIGESRVSRKLKRLKKKKYIVLNDLLLSNGTSTSQVDHIVISKSGIFVIETKNYKGWIHGHQNSPYWTQTIYKHKKKLRNPIKQNWGHVYTIKKVLSKYRYIEYFPIVVFAGTAKLKNITSSLPVIYRSKLLKTIKRQNVKDRLSYDQMLLIANQLNQANSVGRKEKRKHVTELKKRVRERKKKEKLKICPKCGNKLILKKGTYGKFYGCPNFPKCR